MSKTALSMCLKNEKTVLPTPNCLPESYKEAYQMIKPMIIETKRYDACVNDCLLFCKTSDNDHSLDRECTKCGEPRYKAESFSARKTFTYMPIGPRLSRIFGSDNICKILYSRQDLCNGKLTDITDGKIYKSWYEDGGVFQDMEESCTVPLALFCDGLNPHKSMATQKSMWPLILTWLNLPVNVRNILGPMMLVGIVPGTKTEEPKNLDPYLDLLVDELLELTECTMFNAYRGAPTSVRIALLHYMCDIPAFSKILHVSSQAALRGCPYCKEEGFYCKSLHKVVHINNRAFLPENHPLRKEKNDFAIKGEDRASKPESYTKEEELEIRNSYDQLPNQNRKSLLQKKTGLKGKYSFMRLPYHNRQEQMQPDGMHTIADVIGNLFGLITGKDDGKKVREGEEEFQRFKDSWNSRTIINDEETVVGSNKRKSNTEDGRKAKKARVESMTAENELPPAPWRLDRSSVKIADQRAMSLVYPTGYDYHPDQHFSKPWTLRTMHGKHQFVTSGAALWCLRGLLPSKQETTLGKLFNVIELLTSESYHENELEFIIESTSEAVSLVERDFPIALQTITTHLLHHIPEGFANFGPLYGRWLFPFERVNSWITRQALNKNKIEATIMETYAIYDWCVYMIMSGKVKQDGIDIGKLERLLLEDEKDDSCSTNEKTFSIDDNILREMSNVYDFCLVARMSKEGKELASCTRSYGNTTYGNTGRKINFSPFSNNRSSNSYVYTVDENSTDSLVDSIIFGSICKIFEHVWKGQTYTWVLLDIFDDVRYEDGFWSVLEHKTSQKPVMLKDVSAPQIVGRENDRLHYVRTCI
ncbi:Hypothetical predicted protein [Mytilus galloprovincialis]|uniref:DUF4218 domain-containing protein n=1 Tax=Mytilus galloprovincialis TaxID=29158 RepID=A0A8B6GJH4_MYTGA|nr:Hypothetical predicted protein [Mytilus galloprovincialis]